jgi:hypothetical protein
LVLNALFHHNQAKASPAIGPHKIEGKTSSDAPAAVETDGAAEVEVLLAPVVAAGEPEFLLDAAAVVVLCEAVVDEFPNDLDGSAGKFGIVDEDEEDDELFDGVERDLRGIVSRHSAEGRRGLRTKGSIGSSMVLGNVLCRQIVRKVARIRVR